jgi:hypothetical protein
MDGRWIRMFDLVPGRTCRLDKESLASCWDSNCQRGTALAEKALSGCIKILHHRQCRRMWTCLLSKGYSCQHHIECRMCFLWRDCSCRHHTLCRMPVQGRWSFQHRRNDRKRFLSKGCSSQLRKESRQCFHSKKHISQHHRECRLPVQDHCSFQHHRGCMTGLADRPDCRTLHCMRGKQWRQIGR